MKGLAALGWDPALAQGRRLGGNLFAARVSAASRGACRLMAETGDWTGVMAGKFRLEENRPVVGDWVAAEKTEAGRAVIRDVFPRRTRIARKTAGREHKEQVVAANVDTAFIVAGLDGDFNVRRLERYLAVVWNGGVNPVLLLNKADLCADTAQKTAEAAAVAAGVPVLLVSAATGAGLDTVTAKIEPAKTAVFIGSSGVGKSTLINKIVGSEMLAVREVRESDSRGRHTTTTGRLVVLAGGGIVIDTPGLRELAAFDDDGGGLNRSFSDVEVLSLQCKFTNCRHETEPGCEVRGKIPPDRLAGFQKLRREREERERKRKWRV